MISVDSVILELKALYDYPHVHFRLPEYMRFHNDIREFVYENHFEYTEEWDIISQNLIYKSTQHLIRQEADTILIQLEELKRKMLSRENMPLWVYIHPRIERVAREKYNHGFFADAVESAFKEVNHRVKQIYLKQRGEEKDGQDLMRTAFSPKDPVLTFEASGSTSAKNVQEGYMQIFAGAMQGIRNPKAHENQTISEDSAIKRLFLASLLMDKIDEAVVCSNIVE